MAATIKTSLTIQETLLAQADSLAQELNISRNRVFEMALEQFVKQSQNKTPLDAVKANEQPAAQIGEERVINQGEIYWVRLDDIRGSEAGIPHPHVVIQDNLFNHSRIHTVVACALTSNIKRASIPGNVLLEADEANLPKPSMVEISKVSTIDKAQLGEYIGSLSEQRVNQILAGMRFLQRSFFER